MFVVAPSTVWNSTSLDPRIVQNKVLGRLLLVPRRDVPGAVLWRLIFENQLLRYFIALLPFVIAMFVWPRLALPIAQAPLLMIFAIGFVEMRVLHIPKPRRAGLTDAVTVARSMDALRFRGTKALRRIAASHDLAQGELLLIVEQSELANIAPLTLVSVHTDTPDPAVLDLLPQDRAMLHETLFDDTFSQQDLQLANQRENIFVRRIAFDTRAVSAHARLSAYLDRTPPAPAAGAPA